MEIVGLLIIVVLVVMIIFFSLIFTSRQPERQILTFQDRKIAGQIGTVIAETTVECGTRTNKLRELIIDCASLKEINCYHQDSCQKINNTIEEILKNTLDQDLEYSFTITGLGEGLITNFTTNRCKQARRAEQFTTPIGTRQGSITIITRLCY